MDNQIEEKIEKKIETIDGTVPISSGQLYYKVSGNGPALVLIHAGVADLTMWEAQVAAFSPNYRVICYDMRGYGKTLSFFNEEGVTFSPRQDLLDLLDYLQIEKTVLIGVSMGGGLAVDFTLEHPERVAALIPVSAGLSGFDQSPSAEEQAALQQAQQYLDNEDYDNLFKLLAKVWVDGPLSQPDPSREALRDQIYHMQVSNSQQQLKNGKTTPISLQPPAAGSLHEIKAPTLVIWGKRDASSVIAACQKLAAEIPGAQKLELADTAHMVNMERPEQFDRAVLNFLKKLKLAGK